MKSISFLFLLNIFTISLFAQNYDFTISESKMVLGGGLNNTLSVTIYESSEKEIIKNWKSLLKKKGAKVDVGKEIVANNVLLKDLGDLPFNCFASVKELDNSTFQLNVSIYLGGSYLSFREHPDKYKTFSDFLSEFAKSTTLEAIESQIKMAKQVLNKKENDLGKLEDSKERLERDIEEWKKDIQKAEDDLEINLIEQDEKTKEVQVAAEELKAQKDKLELAKKSK